MARDLALERAWRKRMREYEGSGLTIQEFCDREGLVAHQFSWWRSELRRRSAKSEATNNGPRSRKSNPKKGKRAKAAATSFVPVQISSQGSSGVEVVLDQPARIRVSSGFDAELLREVVRVLERR